MTVPDESLTLPFTTAAPNGVRVMTRYDGEAAEYETLAVWRDKVLSTGRRGSAFFAGQLHELLVSAWGSASEGNLIDEAADAPRFDT
jgi:hypothetical protein